MGVGVSTRTDGGSPNLGMLKSPSWPSIWQFCIRGSNPQIQPGSCAARFTDPGWLNLWMSEPMTPESPLYVFKENSSLRIKEGI